MEKNVEKIEIWVPVKEGGEAIRADGTHMKRVAILVNGYPILLDEGYFLEKRTISNDEADNLKALIQQK